MKSINKALFVATAALSLAACNDLDTDVYGRYVSEEQKVQAAEKDPEMLRYAAAGINSLLGKYPAVSGSESYHDDFGLPSMMLFLDSRGTDLVGLNVGYNWFAASGMMNDATPTARHSTYAWRNPFNDIYSCNNLLASTGEETDINEQMYFIAQARGYRAFSYWLLAQLFQHNYEGHEQKPCVPIITSANSNEVALAGGAPRATVEQVYQQILDDLEVAIEYMGTTTVKVSDIVDSKPNRMLNLASLLGLRARVYLTMHKYAEAADDALAAINASKATPATFDQVMRPDRFWSLDENNWMWGIAVSENDRTVTSGICNFPSHMGDFSSGSYAAAGAWRFISETLFNQIPTSDARRGWWLDADGLSNHLEGSFESWQADATDWDFPPYSQVKFGPYQGTPDNSTRGNDIVLMRIEEMYLIRAEGLAMSGFAGAAKQLLSEFMEKYRDPDYICPASDPEGIQNEVWNQRRIEFWGEGLSYFDILRLNKGIDRRGSNWPAEWTYNIEPGADVLIFCIPQSEVEANPFITPADNNPSPTTPTPVQ